MAQAQELSVSMHPIYTHALYLLKRPPCPPHNCAHVCEYLGLSKQVP